MERESGGPDNLSNLSRVTLLMRKRSVARIE